ncbi:hypothetical protein APHAL10511_005268 [Amanita phalloides]|nr:hypothetical protein APHAL10511_005268 [Amanita phalloides]
MLETLPVDICLAILSHLDPNDILSIRQTCKALTQATYFRSVWTKKIADQDIPIPGLFRRPLEELDAQELERCVYRALRLHKRWSHPPDDAPLRRIDFGEGHIALLRFLQCHGHRHLVALRRVKPHGRIWETSCWDIHADTRAPVCVGRRPVHGVPSLHGFAFNVDGTNPAIFAMQLDHYKVEIMGLDLTSHDPSKTFVTLATYPSRNRKLRHMSGANLISVDRHERAFLWNQDYDIELRDNLNANHREHDARGFLVVQDQYLFICRMRELLLYVLPPIHLRKGHHILYPVAAHRWQWAIDSICMEPRMPKKKEMPGRPPLINILLRFGSFLPWPINLLHYYTLEPNLSFDAREAPTSNLPYLFPPQLKRTIAAPILMFSSSHMTLGSYGTALWIDNHAEEYFATATRGQRIAGLSCPTLLKESACNAEEALQDEWKSCTMAAAVYAIQKGEGWTKLAMDEEEGRIAVGSEDGQILIIDYA